MSKLIRVVVILFWGIVGYSLCLDSEEFPTFLEEELDTPNDVEEDHNELNFPTLYSSEYKNSETEHFNGNIQNNRNTVSSYEQSISPCETRSKNGIYRGSKYKKSSSTSQYKPVYVRGYYRRDGTYVRSHYRSRASRRR